MGCLSGVALGLLLLGQRGGGAEDQPAGGKTAAALEKQKALYAATVAQLSDPATTTIVLVARAEISALREAERTRHELRELGVSNLRLALNGVFAAGQTGDEVALAMESRAAAAVASIPAGLSSLPRDQFPFLPRGTVGLDSLRAMVHPAPASEPGLAPLAPGRLPAGLAPLVDDLERAGHGVIMTMGKGGVGKTTMAAAMAVALAARGHQVVLSTTDPAAHLAATMAGHAANLSVARIDPEAEVSRYRDEVLAKAGASLDQAGRAMLEEDLRSPCTEEIAVFRAFARTVDEGRDAFVVLDTAPTGHTILLLDAADAYHREVLRTQADMPEAVRNLLPRLRDPAYTRILIVTLAEATPVHEAERLSQDLGRAGITPYAWVINQSLLASGTTHPLLAQRGRYETAFIRKVADELAPRTALVPWQAEAPVGEVGLLRVVR
ncbi:MAG: AAA family ATPase, partial [Magnetospirillum sp.]|nr:AAA family ATPase [Magnetospirillum sp.]